MEATVSVTVALRYTNTKRKTEFISNDGARGNSAEGNGLLFHFYPAEIVSGIRPYEGPARGGTTVTLTGSNFRSTPELVARFAVVPGDTLATGIATTSNFANVNTTTVVPARFISNTEVAVEAPKCPPGVSGGENFFFVQVSSNGVDFTPSADGPVYFYDASEPFVEALSPAVLREGGGVLVTIRGFGFPETYPSTLACVFGDGVALPVPATRHSAEVLTCVAPSHRPGLVVVTVTSFGQAFSSDNDLTVEYVSAWRISSSWPVLGPATGGTTVTVLGDGFRVEEAYLCAFGSILPNVGALFLNTSAIMCDTPQLSGDPEVSLRIGVLRDDGASLMGGETYGYGVIYNDSDATDITGTDDSAFTSLPFKYHDEVDILKVSPINGPASGGTVIRVSGRGFLDLPSAACRFGVGEPTRARVIDEQTLVCKSNSFVSATGTEGTHQASTNVSRVEKGVALRVTMNGVDFSPTNTSVSFLYDDDVAVRALIPNRGPATGGMRVIVRGTGFRQDERLACRFGLQVVAVAEYISTEAIACIAPPQSRQSAVTVSVTLNGQDFTPRRVSAATSGGSSHEEGPMFTYTDRASVTAIEPEMGPTRGGTVVSVFGVNFADTAVVLCRFGNVITTVAEFVSTDMVTCVSPAVPASTGRVHLEVSDHGMVGGDRNVRAYSDTGSVEFDSFPEDPGDDPALWTNSGVEFTYSEDAEVLAAFPSAGPADGGTRVSLTGFGFEAAPGLGCRFGDTTASFGGDHVMLGLATEVSAPHDVSAIYVSPTEVVCVSPPRPFAGLSDDSGAVTVRVAVTLNGLDYGLRMAQFTYYSTPKVSAVYVRRLKTVTDTTSGWDSLPEGESLHCRVVWCPKIKSNRS